MILEFVVWFLLLSFGGYMLFRNNGVYSLRTEVLDEDSSYCRKRVANHLGFDGHRMYAALPSYDRLWLTFWKPLRTFRKEMGRVEDYYEGTIYLIPEGKL